MGSPFKGDVQCSTASQDELLIALFTKSYETPPHELGLGPDSTDDPLGGSQEGDFFHAIMPGWSWWPLVSSADWPSRTQDSGSAETRTRSDYRRQMAAEVYRRDLTLHRQVDARR